MDKLNRKLSLAAVLSAALVGGCGGGSGGGGSGAAAAAAPDSGIATTALVASMNSIIGSTDENSEPIDIAARTLATDDQAEPVKL